MSEVIQLHGAIEQRSEAWYAARCGSLGASDIHKVIAKLRDKVTPAASRANILTDIIVERLTGKPVETYQSKAMQEGIEKEPMARAAYIFRTDNKVREVGLIKHPKITGTHSSPDGLVNDDAVLEIKCPERSQHLKTLLGEPIDDKYIVQCLWQMRTTDRAYADFVSFHPEFPESMKLFIQQIPRDDGRIANIEGEVKQFLAEVEEKLAVLKEKYGDLSS